MDSDKSVTANFSAASTGGDGEKKGGCFIATAAYGSALHPYVKILQDFREMYLIPYKLGRKIVVRISRKKLKKKEESKEDLIHEF